MNKKMSMGLIYLFGSLGGLLFGYDTGVISGAILFIQDELNLAEWGQGWVVSSVLLGAVLGSIVIGPLSDRVGRKRLLLAASIVFFIGALGSGLAMGLVTLLVSRVILGIGVGIASSLIPTYLSELAPAHKRGALSGLFQLMVMTGILLAYISNYALADIIHGWRWMLGLAALPAAILFFGAMVLPESPRFLVRKGQDADARDVLVQIYKGDSAEADTQLKEIQELAHKAHGRWADLFSRDVRPALVAALGLAVFQQVMAVSYTHLTLPTIYSV